MIQTSEAKCKDCEMNCNGAPDLVLFAVNLHKVKTGHRVDMVRIEKRPKELLTYFEMAYSYCIKNHENEIKWQDKAEFRNMDYIQFFKDYVWVVLCSGFSVRGAQKIYDLWSNEPTNFEIIKHPLKRKAIKEAFSNAEKWFKILQSKQTDQEKLEYLQTLPHIGPVTKYHLGKNLGLQVAKPDVHLVRIATEYGYDDVQTMCEFIAREKEMKVPTVDIILWRYRADGEPII